MNSHHFDVEIAKEYCIEVAIIIENLSFWIEKNKANEKHFHDGSYWTYNSIKAFTELFPYMSESTIRRALKTLEENGIIKTGNYNKVGYDRTLWYAITEKGFSILDKSILSKQQMELQKTTNGIDQNSKPIPDIKPIKKQDNELFKETIETKKENPYKEIYDVYIVSYKELFGKEPIIMYSAMTKRIKTLLIDITKEQIINAIIFAKKDNFCVNTTKYQLQTILSEKVLPRLINASIQNSYSSSSPNIYNGAGRAMAKICPECGSELDNYLTCPKCKIEYDVSGKAIK